MTNTQNYSNFQYENVFKGNMGALYARLYNPSTKECITKSIKVIPSFYIHDKNSNSGLVSIPEQQPLKELTFKTMKEYRDAVNMYKDSGVAMYGNKSQEQTFIREHWPNPIDAYHEFSNTWYYDIETAILDDDMKPDKSDIRKNDWKPMSHQRGAMATITSIQIFDSKANMFFILGLNKEWDNDNNYESEYGTIKYINCKTEEQMLKLFLELLKKRDPTLMTGWNTKTYDDPYLTNRIIRVLDKRDDLYYYDELKQRWRFNTDCLNGEYVKQLSPHANLIKHKEVQTSYGIQDEFLWVGIIQEDYMVMYKKYTYTTHTSYSLDTVAGYELGSNKVNHDEHTDFAEFYINNFNTFIEYGVRDVELLIGLDRKLKLIDLAKMISYETGVTMDMIRGTLAQWNSYMFNNHFKKSHVLPLEGKFDETDTVLLDRISRDEKFRSLIPKERVEFYMNLINEHEQDPGTKLKSQTFPGGIVKGTGKFWRWVYSLDFASLYPSVIQWLNIGIETLIEPKDLPDELLLLRAKYAIFYPRNVKPKDLIQYDFWFQKHVVNNDEVSSEVMRVCKKYNVSMAPNGMFFRKDVRSVLSQTMEDIMVKRKKYKKLMQGCFKEIEEIKKKDNYSDEDKARISEIQKEADKWNVYQMGMKILINSAYGALSMQATVFAGHAEYFSGAVTSGARNANLNAIQANSKHIDKLLGEDDKETFNGIKTYWRHIAQVDTDSGYFSIEPLMIKKWGADYEKENSKERLVDFTKNYIEKISLPLTYVSLNKQSDTINAYLPEKLIEDPEVICDNFISIAPKMYFARKWWDEGITLSKPKLKVTGLSMVRATTPKFFRKELGSAMDILIDGNLPKVIEFMEDVKQRTGEQKPSQICINQGVSSLDYEWQEQSKKFKRWVPEKNKWLSAPVNSRASLVHNKYINEKKIEGIKEIEPGDKIGFIYMKEPNITGSNAFAFNNDKVFEYGLDEYIDRELMFEKQFEGNIKLITDPIGWDLTPASDLIDEDEW